MIHACTTTAIKVGEKHIKTYNYINWFNFKLSTPNLKQGVIAAW